MLLYGCSSRVRLFSRAITIVAPATHILSHSLWAPLGTKVIVIVRHDLAGANALRSAVFHVLNACQHAVTTIITTVGLEVDDARLLDALPTSRSALQNSQARNASATLELKMNQGMTETSEDLFQLRGQIDQALIRECEEARYEGKRKSPQCVDMQERLRLSTSAVDAAADRVAGFRSLTNPTRETYDGLARTTNEIGVSWDAERGATRPPSLQERSGRRLVLAIVWKVPACRVVPFISTLHAVCEHKCDIVIFTIPFVDDTVIHTERYALVEALVAMGVHVIVPPARYWFGIDMQTRRFEIYYEYLKHLPQGMLAQYETIFMSDFTDVIFQASPFNRTDHDAASGVTFSLEGAKIGGHGDMWLESLMEMYGLGVKPAANGAPISNSGVVWGSVRDVITYLSIFVHMVWHDLFVWGGFGGWDQTVHNYIVYALPRELLALMNARTLSWERSISYVLGGVGSYNITDALAVVTPDGFMPPVLHYQKSIDRFKQVRWRTPHRTIRRRGLLRPTRTSHGWL
jgi:hypothetical protein